MSLKRPGTESSTNAKKMKQSTLAFKATPKATPKEVYTSSSDSDDDLHVKSNRVGKERMVMGMVLNAPTSQAAEHILDQMNDLRNRRRSGIGERTPRAGNNVTQETNTTASQNCVAPSQGSAFWLASQSDRTHAESWFSCVRRSLRAGSFSRKGEHLGLGLL